MKKVILVFCVLFGFLFTTNLYAEDIIIGTQKWMPANLNVDHYQNGDPIPQVTDPTIWASLTTGAWCYYNNDPANGAIYGKLYNWYAVNDPRGLAPEGYHVSSDAEWTILTTYLGGEEVAGGKLKEIGANHWLSPNEGATNEVNFTALAGGYRTSSGNFYYLKSNGVFWTSSEIDNHNSWNRHLYYYVPNIIKYEVDKKNAYSIRCAKDEPPTLQTGLVAYYPFNGNANDESGKGNNGTNNGATPTTDRFGNSDKAYYFDGSSYITLSNYLPDIDIFTLNLWVKINSSGSKIIFNDENGNCQDANDFRLGLYENGVILRGDKSGRVLGKDQDPGSFYTFNKTIINEWHMITYEIGCSNNFKIFLDGVKLLEQGPSGCSIGGHWQPLIGRMYCYSGFPYIGKLDDIRIYNRALSDNEVEDLYNEGNETAPTLTTPSNNATDQPRNLTFKWEALTGASEYQIQASTSQDFSSITLDTKTTSTSLVATSLSNNKTYYWRVKAKKGDIFTPWSEVWKFTTVSGNIDLVSGLVAHYPFTDGSTQDFSGNGNHGTKNGATKTTDRFGNTDCAYSFDGNDFITVDDDNTLDLYDKFTLSSWFTISQFSNEIIMAILSKDRKVCGGTGYQLRSFENYMNAGISAGFNWNENDEWNDNKNIPIFSYLIPYINTWYNVITTYDGINLKLFVNGELKSNLVRNIKLLNSSNPINLGRGSECLSFYHIGKLDDIRIYNRALSEAEVAALYGTKNVALPAIYTSNPLLEIGDSQLISGRNFANNVEVNINISAGDVELLKTVTTDSFGNFDIEIGFDEFEQGIEYTCVANDVANSVSASTKFQTKKYVPPVYYIKIINPTEFNKSFSSNAMVRFTWTDFINVLPEHDFNGTTRKYIYDLQFYNGINWHTLKTITDRAKVYSEETFHTDVIASNLNEKKFRIVDKSIEGIERTSNETPYLTSVQATDFEASIEWDGLNKQKINQLKLEQNPKGVCADGVSRVYIKIENLREQEIKKVVVNLYQIYNHQKVEQAYNETKEVGRLLLADKTKINEYDNSGSNAVTQTLEVDNINSTEDIYFWYISPLDFMNNDIDYRSNGKRWVCADIDVYYAGETDPINRKIDAIEIVRPPVMLVHGIGSDENLWKDKGTYKKGVSFLNDKSEFFVTNTPNMRKSAAFSTNADDLLKYHFPFTLDEMIRKGYASSQVDYIGHSMGGLIVRKAFEMPEFKSQMNYENKYGYVHKLITLNSPHFGSPWGNFLNDLIPIINIDEGASIQCYPRPNMNCIKSKLFESKAQNKILFTDNFFVIDDPGSYQINDITLALKDLRYFYTGETSSIKETQVPNHLIAGDFINGVDRISEDNKVKIKKYWKERILLFVIPDLFLMSESSAFLNKYFTGDFDLAGKSFINYGLLQIEKILKNYTKDSDFNAYYNNGFIANSDLVVSLESQLAGKSPSSQYVSLINNIGHAFVNEAVENNSVKNKLLELLNSTVDLYSNDNKFDNSIPANNYRINKPVIQGAKSIKKNEAPEQEFVEPILNIKNPTKDTVCLTNTFIEIDFSLSDFTNLQYIEVLFQSEVQMIESPNFEYHLTLPINGGNIGENYLEVIAYYFDGQNSYNIRDYKIIDVKTEESLQHFDVNPTILNLKKNQFSDFNIRMYYQTFYTGIFDIDSMITQMNNLNVVSIDLNSQRIKAIDTGETNIIFSYNGLQDTIIVYVEGELPKPEGMVHLSYPQNLTFNISISDTLKWEKSINADYYYIYISKDSLFGDLINSNISSLDTTFSLENLGKNITYFWRVKAIGLGGESDWSDTWSFTTEPEKQNILLSSGWNLISSFIIPQEPDSMQYVCNDIKNNMTLAKNGAGKTYIPAYNINQIGKWDYKQAYQVYMIKADTLVVAGMMSDPINDPIDLALGWSMTAYLRSTPMDAPVALASIIGENKLLLAKNNKGKTFIPQFGINQIGNLMPGEGYQLYNKSAVQLTYPANEFGKGSTAFRTPNPKYLIPKYEVTGNSAVALISVTAPDGNEIGVYNQNDELIGSGVVQNNIASVTIWGDDEQTEIIDGAEVNAELRMMNYELKSGRLSDVVILGLEDFITGEKVDKLSYSKDAVYFAKTGVIQNSTNISLNVRPNPASDIIEIEFTTPDCQATELSIYSIDGKLIANLSGKLHDLKSNLITHNISSFTSGEYTIILTCENERAMRKVVVVR